MQFEILLQKLSINCMNYFSDQDQNQIEDILKIISNSVGKTLIRLDFTTKSSAVLQDWNAFVEPGIMIKLKICNPEVTTEMIRALFRLRTLQDLLYFSIIHIQRFYVKKRSVKSI